MNSSLTSKLLANLGTAIAEGLKRSAVTTASSYATTYRVMGKPYPGPWSFDHHPWTRAMHDSICPRNVGEKAAQMGYTEAMLNLTFFTIDIKRVSVLYVLPTKTPDASEFSASRFDPALELSPHLKALFSDVKNIGHKRAGSTSLYVRGARSRAGLKSIPAGLLIFDEVDEMEEEMVTLAEERQSGQLEEDRGIWKISTPSVDEHGVDKDYRQSTMEHFFFTCPSCSRQEQLVWPQSICITADDWRDPRIRESHLICTQCGVVLPHEAKPMWLTGADWVAQHPHKMREMRGFHINQMYSPTIHPSDLAIMYLKAATNAADEQEFYNSKLGLTHLVKDAKVTMEQINACLRNYKNGSPPASGTIVTAGIDVGKFLHYCVKEWRLPASTGAIQDLNVASGCRILEAGKVLQFESLDQLLMKYRPHMTIIDAHPEKRKAYEFAQRFWGFVKLCYYGNSVNGKTIHVGKDDMEATVTVDRTSWLDLSQGRYMQGSIGLPIDIPLEFKDHVCSLYRIPKKDRHGNVIATYVNIGDDHYGHASNYAEIALPLAVTTANSSSIISPV